ncbi:hypothetical protein D3C75_818180 [compost metagenome]
MGQLGLGAAQRFFGLFAGGHVHQRAQVFKASVSGEERGGEQVQMLDAPVGHQQAVPDLDQGRMARRLFETGQHQGQVIGVGALQVQGRRGGHARRVFEHACHLLRPAHACEVCAKAEATGLGQALGTGHVDFLVAQAVADPLAAQRQKDDRRQHRQAAQQIHGRLPAVKATLIQAHRRQHQHAEQRDHDHRADRQQVDRHQQQRDVQRGRGEVGPGFAIEQDSAGHDQAHQPHQGVFHWLEAETEQEARDPLT